MVRQNRDEDMGFSPFFCSMVDGTESQFVFEATKGGFYPVQHHICIPYLLLIPLGIAAAQPI
jgi:hypothetical protein